MADPQARETLFLLQDTNHSLHVEDLAERLVKQNTTIVDTSDYEDEYDQVLMALHHNHLPKFDNAGLVDYDRDENVVAYRGGPTVDAEWLDCTPIGDVIDHFETEGEIGEDAIGVLEGSETISEHGRWLAGEADEELFCMYVSDDLLGEECVRRAEDAIDRGVDFYMGSQNPNVREFTRNHLPEATLWEPQRDWMNAASDDPTIGRLVFADRTKLMLGFAADPEAGESSGETALIGEGADNPLVVFVRELMGPRLDHLDYQSKNFQSELGFQR